MPEPKYDDEAVPDSSHSEKDESPYRTERSGSQASRRKSVAAKLKNPLAGLSKEQVFDDVETFCRDKGLDDHMESFKRGALVAQVQNQANAFENINELNEEEKDVLRNEVTHKWRQPFMMYFLVVLCAGSAIVQGMDQTAVNGAQL